MSPAGFGVTAVAMVTGRSRAMPNGVATTLSRQSPGISIDGSGPQALGQRLVILMAVGVAGVACGLAVRVAVAVAAA